MVAHANAAPVLNGVPVKLKLVSDVLFASALPVVVGLVRMKQPTGPLVGPL